MIKVAREIPSEKGDNKRENTKRDTRGALKLRNQRVEEVN